MSLRIRSTRLTVPQIVSRKGKDKIVCLTAYSAPMAALLDAHVDLLLVGDSVGMVVHGLPSTVGVTLEMMILHGKAVIRGSERALVVIDMPFGSYERSPAQAYDSAVKIMQETGCQAAKVEACEGIADTVAFLVKRGIPVVGHVGIRPQAVHTDGGFKTKGHTIDERQQILADARQVSDAGAFAIVVEGVVSELADEITRAVSIPTIGIGASSECDGQVLVVDDMLGLFEWTPRFVRRYASLHTLIDESVAAYAMDVRNAVFPNSSETYAARKT
ncbi:3-methyl-2-oxobutanoate hydroxymethyltransferase [Pseudomonas sp. DR48]|uniref:3-methyl-2-oxobutanoate hydroxymethyltransferase n=1 Tax=Pseudomonas sp. DR48 TaxID=2871095 RepID=UPI001C9924A6|nr:3-methyl-2-oxobutanoate hydroxymethyltransferase [Pseudomonas sp. DR48]QZP31526.1 3-methyl-2-oxobutanoate hydroxymethyltransferase [Pseudomonas sp. DR48]